MSAYVTITALIFVVFAIAHTVRLARGWQVHVGPHNIAMSLSWIALTRSRHRHMGRCAAE